MHIYANCQAPCSGSGSGSGSHIDKAAAANGASGRHAESNPLDEHIEPNSTIHPPTNKHLNSHLLVETNSAENKNEKENENEQVTRSRSAQSSASASASASAAAAASDSTSRNDWQSRVRRSLSRARSRSRSRSPLNSMSSLVSENGRSDTASASASLNDSKSYMPAHMGQKSQFPGFARRSSLAHDDRMKI